MVPLRLHMCDKGVVLLHRSLICNFRRFQTRGKRGEGLAPSLPQAVTRELRPAISEAPVSESESEKEREREIEREVRVPHFHGHNPYKVRYSRPQYRGHRLGLGSGPSLTGGKYPVPRVGENGRTAQPWEIFWWSFLHATDPI